MKDNKYAPYVLGPVLLVVWGLVFYKIYQAVYGSEEVFDIPQYNKLPVFEEKQEDSTYVLLVDYKDPFLGKRFYYSSDNNGSAVGSRTKSSRTKSTPPKISKKTPQPIVQNVTSKPFPAIVYQGYQVMDNDTVALLKINNRFYPIARKRDVFQQVHVKEIYKDSIRLQFGQQEQTFMKKR
ncbi:MULTISPECIES: hypothetical protein [unclassified Aureispira]|uniref:hypothetical protein n=1 Tax=unclassified Aureispira TaxID=2649989 RepID=UPI000695D3F9|nr:MULTISPECIES: hypothetical protein [unclassified Aureispira]WMX12600.1 hypothetical protein QP953_17355 [Aureispira sp. CCB-E]